MGEFHNSYLFGAKIKKSYFNNAKRFYNKSTVFPILSTDWSIFLASLV